MIGSRELEELEIRRYQQATDDRGGGEGDTVRLALLALNKY
jgi:hypothetical protein